MTATWEETLEQCEARLDAAVAALEQGTTPEVDTFSEPRVAGPIPPALADRARACSERGEELAELLARELERIRLELRRLPRMPAPQRDTHIDVSA